MHIRYGSLDGKVHVLTCALLAKLLENKIITVMIAQYCWVNDLQLKRLQELGNNLEGVIGKEFADIIALVMMQRLEVI